MKKFNYVTLALLLIAGLGLSGCFKKKNNTVTPGGDDNPSGGEVTPGGNDNPGGGSGGGEVTPTDPTGGETNPDGTVTVYLDLGQIGLYEGKKGQEYADKFLENAIQMTGKPGDALPGADKVTSTSGAKFLNWMYYNEEGKTGAPTKYEVLPGFNCILLANWEGGSGQQGGGEQGGGEQGGGGQTTGAHGPEGSELVSWYLVGEGSLWSTPWDVSSGVQLYSNPGSTDKGCILNITFAVNDAFKVTNGTDIWFGYEKVDPYTGENNKGLTCFEGADDGYNGKNFKCTVAGAYNMYVNSEGVFWIEAA